MKKAVLLHPLNTKGRQWLWKAFSESSLKVWGQHKTSATEKRRQGKEPLTKEHQREHQGGTRDSEEKFKYNNTTTKSLILAQDER